MFRSLTLTFTLHFLRIVLHTLDSAISSATVPMLLDTASNLPGSLHVLPYTQHPTLFSSAINIFI